MIAADIQHVQTLRQHGIKMPVACVRAAKKAKLPLPAAAALLMMETGGGANVFGHDPTIFIGGAVTRQRYLAYKAERKRTGKMQGVGPTQLTWYEYQDECDRLGGCDKPEVNMQVGFSILRAHIQRYGVRRGFEAYNGSGHAAVAYGVRAARLYQQFQRALGHTPPPKPKKVTLPRNWWKKWVVGDTDCDREILVALANVARDYSKATKQKVVINVRCGKRTYAEQLALYRLYLSGKGNLAAKPGTSNHQTGKAGDCGIRVGARAEVNIGSISAVRALMKKRGLCLPVTGENWHVERGHTWRA